MNCPCSSGQAFDRCCGRFISQQDLPENAEQLMRSRYTAFVRKDLDYLAASWHPDFRPANLEIDESLRWLGLEIISSEQLNGRARVEFEARFLRDGGVGAIHENSRFVREQDRWLYTDGDMLAPTFTPWKPGRNESCPCGSGQKFKRCCGP